MSGGTGHTPGPTVIIRLHSLGDVVLAQPVISALSKLDPVYFVTAAEYTPVAQRMEGAIPVGHDRNHGARGLRRILRELEPVRIVDLQGSLTTRTATAGMPVTGRYGTDRAARRRVMRRDGACMVPRRLEFLKTAGLEGGGYPQLRRETAGPEDLTVGLVAGGRWHLKTLHEGVVAEAARLLVDLYGARVVITGGPGDEETVSRSAAMVERDRVSTYCGNSGIGGLMEVLEGLSLLISPDSGPAHLAAALGVPVIVVFTSTSERLGFWEPGTAATFDSGYLECRPCHKHGGSRCRRGDEICRRGIVPLDLVACAMGMLEK